MQARIIEPSDARWAAFLESVPHDFYHLPEYVAVSAPYDGGDARALMVTGDNGQAMLLPMITRPLPDGLQDAVSPYGYPGPLVAGSGAFLRAALDEGYRALAREGVVSLFVRLHPILNSDLSELPGMVVQHGETVIIDLSKTADEQWNQMKKAHRQQIRRAERTGSRVFIDTDLTHLVRFAQLYRATMQRRGAREFYIFDDAYFERLAAALGSRFNLCVIERDGHLAAAGIFVETNGIVQSHLSADNPERTHGGLKKLLYDFIRKWANERGDRWFHLGGGVGAAADTLLQFKGGFSPLRLPFHSLRVVTRESDYQQLVGSSAPVTNDGDDFFPAYRRP